MPSSVDIIFTPLITLLVVGFFSLYAVVPVAGVLSDGITSGINWVLDIGGVVAGALLAGFFLPLVMVGLHHGLTPIHLELIEKFGMTPLFPILAMAGAGQVGAAIAIFVKTKNQRLRNIIKGDSRSDCSELASRSFTGSHSRSVVHSLPHALVLPLAEHSRQS